MRVIRLLSLLIVMWIAMKGAADAQTLHVLLISATDDASIGPGAAANAKGIADFTKFVARSSGLKEATTEVRGAKFSCQAISDAVNGLSPGPDDVIFIYYSGHGFLPADPTQSERIAPPDEFPWLFCEFPGARVSLSSLFEVARSKGARLTIMGADACNVVVPGIQLEEKGLARPDAIRSMFRDFRGGILFTSSKRGQFSWYYDWGGIFTSQLLPVLNSPPGGNPKSLWTSVLEKGTKRIRVRTANGVVDQSPLYKTYQLEYLR